MTNHQERESFATALRQAADGIESLDPDALYGGAVRRGNQIKRHKVLTTSAAVVVAVGAAGALAAALGAGAPVKAPAAPSGTTTPHPPTGITDQQVLQAFLASLPRSVDVLRNPAGGAPPQAFGLGDSQTGGYYYSAMASIKSSGTSGWSAVVFSVRHGASIKTCAEAENAKGWPTDTCAITSLDGGTLITDESAKDPSAGEDNPIWNYIWNSPGGYAANISIGDSSVAAFALTKQQIVDVLTDPAWSTLIAQPPAATPQPTASASAATPPSATYVLPTSVSSAAASQVEAVLRHDGYRLTVMPMHSDTVPQGNAIDILNAGNHSVLAQPVSTKTPLTLLVSTGPAH